MGLPEVILVVAALWAEALPLGLMLSERRMQGRRLVLGRLGEHPVALLRCGVGPRRAQQRTEAVVEGLDPAWVLSVGTSGGLDDGLRIGDLVGASEVRDGATGERFVSQPLPGARAGVVLTVERPIHTPGARAAAAQRGLVCEMEAAGVARAARGRRFSALKVVSDHAGGGEDLALKPGDPMSLLRFQRRAAELCAERLAPALRRAIEAG